MDFRISIRAHRFPPRLASWSVVAVLMTLLSGEVLATAPTSAYPVPAKGKIPVAFVISDDAVTIDFSGPWEVFKDVFVPERGRSLDEQAAFRLYTVSDTRNPVTTSGGMRIIPMAQHTADMMEYAGNGWKIAE